MSLFNFSRLTPFERLLSGLTAVRPGEGRGIFLMLAQIFLLMFGYYLLRPLREALILAEGSPEVRAYATGAVALVLIFIIPLYKMLFDYLKQGGRKSAVLRWVGSFFITNLLFFALLVWLDVPVAVPFYIWLGVFSVMVVAQFWAFAADLFNVKTGQRLFALIMVGAALGAWLGSQVAGTLFALLGTPRLMLLAALLLSGALYLSRKAERAVPEGSRSLPTRAVASEPAGLAQVLAGFQVVLRSGYLLRIAVFVLLLNWVNSTGQYILATFASEYAGEAVAASAGALTIGEVLARFYGNFYAWVTALQIGLQLFLVSRIFRWVGVRGAILVLPLVMLASYGLIYLVPVFALVRLMMIAESAANYSIQNTTNHALYLPVTRDEKYIGKTTVDTFFVRFGDLVYAGMILLTAELLGLDVGAITAINIGLSVVLIYLGTAIGRHHRKEIRQNLANLPPVVNTRLPDVYVPAGQMLVFTVPEHAFMDPDPGDALRFQAGCADGSPLPGWVRFDPFNHSFTIRPPAGEQDTLEITVSATDFEGLSVESGFSISYGPDPVPRFIAVPGAPGPGSPGHPAAADAGTVAAAPAARQ
ncbi:ATP translocase [Thioalkalivibrio sp. XN8]|uniref:ATP translocase n=1 Tax=Thioalkalivibrio sp. XN8 TaxID=2712863 RepID=UPI0013E9C03B|nr:ATP translocase [Thioalkalivibrio sp. XN8]NGP53425.1 ATP translocase [Thioalkalivibrio sp. XN8]